MFKISKEFPFCYGHRVHTQNLNHNYTASDDVSKGNCCRHLHGHQGVVTVNVEAEELDCRGFVIDFRELGFMKDIIDGLLDHKMIIDINDPAFSMIVGDVEQLKFKPVYIEGVQIANTICTEGLDVLSKELIEGFVIVDFVPTSEKLCEWFWKVAQIKLGSFARVTSVVFSETPKTKAIYSI